MKSEHWKRQGAKGPKGPSVNRAEDARSAWQTLDLVAPLAPWRFQAVFPSASLCEHLWATPTRRSTT